MREQTALLEQITAPISRIAFGANNVGQGEAIIGNPTSGSRGNGQQGPSQG